MAVSQSTFNATMDKAVAGQLADDRPCTKVTCEASEAIGFGLAVVRTATDDQCQTAVGTSGADNQATNFLGITLRSTNVRPSEADPTVYQPGTNVTVLRDGAVWVVADGAVKQGQDVSFKSTGRLGTAAGSASVKTIPGAVWGSSASNGEMAVVILSDFRHGN